MTHVPKPDHFEYAPFAKIDREQRHVFGYASTQKRDRHGEIVMQKAVADALPNYMLWKTVREMHTQSAVGKAIDAQMDPNGFWFGAHVVDDRAWKKVLNKVYTGFSIGGRVLARDPNDKSIITKIDLTEVSLVDRPACPDATFVLFKRAENGLLMQPTQIWYCGNPDHQHLNKGEAGECMCGRLEDMMKSLTTILLPEAPKSRLELAKENLAKMNPNHKGPGPGGGQFSNAAGEAAAKHNDAKAAEHEAAAKAHGDAGNTEAHNTAMHLHNHARDQHQAAAKALRDNGINHRPTMALVRNAAAMSVKASMASAKAPEIKAALKKSTVDEARERLGKYNHNHAPAGGPEGGRFASAAAAENAAGPMKNKGARYDRAMAIANGPYGSKSSKPAEDAKARSKQHMEEAEFARHPDVRAAHLAAGHHFDESAEHYKAGNRLRAAKVSYDKGVAWNKEASGRAATLDKAAIPADENPLIKFNHAHKGPGPGGGQFASADGGHGDYSAFHKQEQAYWAAEANKGATAYHQKASIASVAHGRAATLHAEAAEATKQTVSAMRSRSTHIDYAIGLAHASAAARGEAQKASQQAGAASHEAAKINPQGRVGMAKQNLRKYNHNHRGAGTGGGQFAPNSGGSELPAGHPMNPAVATPVDKAKTGYDGLVPGFEPPTLEGHWMKGTLAVKHQGREYHSTGKSGTEIKTGAPSWEYADHTDAWIWVRAGGLISND